MSTPLWKVWFTRVATPIGIAVTVILLLRSFVSAIAMSPDEVAYGVECSVLGGEVKTVKNGSMFCVKRTKLELAVPKSFAELCSEANGEFKEEYIDGDYHKQCWTQEMVKELGARHEYTANN